MEDGPGQDVVALPQTAWATKKRPASPLDQDTQVLKRPWNSIPCSRAIGKPLQNVPYQDHAPHLGNTASGWESGAIDAGPSLGFPANDSDLTTSLHPGLCESSPQASVYFTGTNVQHHLAGSGSGIVSFLHLLPVIHLPHAGASWGIPPLQSSATDIVGSCLPLAPTTQSSPLGSAPASAYGHTPPYTPPSLSVTSGLWDISFPPSDMHAPQAHGLWRPDPVSTEGCMTFNLYPSPPISCLGSPPQSTLSSNAVNDFYNPLYPAPGTRRYSAPIMDSNNPYAGFNSPSRHPSMSIHPSGDQHDTWPDEHALPIRQAVVSGPYEQHTQHLGRYVKVINPVDGKSPIQDGHSAFSDVEEAVVADDDDELETKAEMVRGSVPTVDDLSSYGSQCQLSRSSSYVHLSSPSSVRVVQENPALPDTKSERKKRGRFDDDARDETNKTRTLKACVSCRQQRMRCRVNKNDPSASCVDCQRRMLSSSGKILHRCVCVRTFTISSIRIIRPGGLGLTRRWEGTKMVDIADFAPDSMTRTIRMLQGFTQQPIVVKVWRFKPKDGDVTYKRWEYNGVPKQVELEPYCLANIEATADYFRKYLIETAFQGLQEASHTSGPLVQETYRMVDKHVETLRERVRNGSETQRVTKELQFFEAVVTLVWSMRHTTGSVWLDGEEKLGMSVPDEDGYPVTNAWSGKKEVPLPRMIVAQFDSIQNERILPRQLKKVLRGLEDYLSSCKGEWFSMYLAVFMFLHEISVASRDRHRWAHEHRQKTRYGAGDYARLGMYVENFQKASHPLLAYWHYYKCDELDGVDWDALGKTKRLKHLRPYQTAFMRKTAEMMRVEAEDIPSPPDPGRWEHELYFVSHMFKRDWAVGYQTFNFMDE